MGTYGSKKEWQRVHQSVKRGPCVRADLLRSRLRETSDGCKVRTRGVLSQGVGGHWWDRIKLLKVISP